MRPLRLVLVLVLVIGVPLGAPISFVQAIGCPQRPPCEGRGGTGCRGPDGRCGGFREFAGTGGSQPKTHCVFENVPVTGENRDCALAKPAPKNPSAAPSEAGKSAQ